MQSNIPGSLRAGDTSTDESGTRRVEAQPQVAICRKIATPGSTPSWRRRSRAGLGLAEDGNLSISRSQSFQSLTA